MPVLERDPSARERSTDVVAQVTARQKRAAESATTIGGFQENWKKEVRDLLHLETAGTDGASAMGDLKTETDKRTREIDRAAEGNEALHLETLGPTIGGKSPVGGGEGGILINRSLPQELGTTRTARDLRIVGAHEWVHAKSVELHGPLTDEAGKPIAPEKIHEGAAEEFSMEEEGGGKERRDDQPPELYGEGQTIVQHVRAKLGDTALKQTLMGDGDLTRLQPAFSRN